MSEPSFLPIRILAVLADKDELARLQAVLSAQGDIVEALVDLSEASRTLDRGQQFDLAFIDVMAGDHAGLALVHHVSATTPMCEIYALVPAKALASGAQALSLGARGLFSLPLTGDELLTAASNVRTRRAEVEQLNRARDEISLLRRVTEACARLASVVSAVQIPSSLSTAQAIAEILVDELGAREAAIFLDPRASSGHLSSPPTASLPPPSPTREPRSVLPPMSMPTWHRAALAVAEDPEGPSTKRGADDEPWLDEIEGLVAAERIAARRGLAALPIEAATLRGVLLIGGGTSRLDARSGVMLHAIGAQVATALRLAGERERSAREITLKDPTTSAYTFGYFVDVAGREIDRARRFGRRFALVSVIQNNATSPRASARAQVELVESLLSVVSDLDVVAYLDESEGELGVLLPETDGIAAYRLVRSMLKNVRSRPVLASTQIGAATFPHDGTGLSCFSAVLDVRQNAEHKLRSTPRASRHAAGRDPPACRAVDPPSPAQTDDLDQRKRLRSPDFSDECSMTLVVDRTSRLSRAPNDDTSTTNQGLEQALSSMPRDELNPVDASPRRANA
ncbi:MAG: response regulator [Polyangiaceae bacterium]